jgi:protein-tyrosine kinase
VNSLILLRGTGIAHAVPLVPLLAPTPQLAHALDAWLTRHLREVRCEQALVEAIGEPLLAARPAQPEALRALSHQLLEHWFTGGRALIPVISARAGDGRSTLAMALAQEFARQGEPTLLIDADLRAPSLHARFGLPNRLGLADLLDGRDVQMAACRENLALLVAGSVRQDPLELLSRERLRHFLAAAARPFRVVLVDTPAAERGPDFEIFVALARGALLAVRRGEDVARLARLRRRLMRCAARPVASVFT